MEIQQTPENALSHSVVTALINAPIGKVKYCRLVIESAGRGVSALLHSASRRRYKQHF